MLRQDAVALLDSVDAFSDTIQIREAWQTVKAELAQRSDNTGSPKLPDKNEIGNALRDMRAGQGAFVTDLEWGVLTFVYDFIVRQLRAGA